MASTTTVSIRGDDFHVNGQPTYAGRSWRGHRIEGLLMNARLVQATFDDRNPATRSRWAYPDGPWDPERNVREFLAAMPAWRGCGLAAFTVNLQCGSPTGYSGVGDQRWVTSGFDPDGTLREDAAGRLGRILRRADELGMVVIVGLFYFGQDEHLADETAVVRAADAATDRLCEMGFGNVLVEIANEVNVPLYEHAILRTDRVAELIKRVRERSAGRLDTPAGRLFAGTSTGGGAIPPASILEASDLLLLHGNGVGDPQRIRAMVEECRGLDAYRGQPIVFNEDDHFDFDADDNNMIAAVSRHAGWGLFDYRFKGEGFDEGYQSVPVNWGISSDRKRGFFGLLAAMTGRAAEA